MNLLSELARSDDPMATLAATRLVRGTVAGFTSDGQVQTAIAGIGAVTCDCLEAHPLSRQLSVGDKVLLAVFDTAVDPIILGRIGNLAAPQVQAKLHIEATESLTLQCGEASVNLRADGKVMVKGEHVLLRAKGTQRIRAGTVAIN